MDLSTFKKVGKQNQVRFDDLGKISYQKAWDLQQDLLKKTVNIKIANRNILHGPKHKIPHHFLFCEHPHVYTLGRSGSLDHLLLNEKELEEKSATFYKINRGGDITYHGPGQIVGYPILDLDCFFTDIHRYVRTIEEVSIRTIAHFGLEGKRIEGMSGVWLEANEEKKTRKICAIGIHLSRWVSMHGFALNVNTNLEYFKYIVPCGITDKAVTSIAEELGKPVDPEEVKSEIKKHFIDLFNVEFI